MLVRPLSGKTLGFVHEALKQLPALYQDPRRFGPYLNFVSRSRAAGQIGDLDAPCKARRSERREAFVLVLEALVVRLDLLTMRCGASAADGTWIGLSYQAIQAATDLSFTRIGRAIRDLTSAGFISSCQRRELLPDGRYVGYPSIRCLRPLLFQLLGLYHRLKWERKRASDRARERRERAPRPMRPPPTRLFRAAGLAPSFPKVDRAAELAADATRRNEIQVAGAILAELRAAGKPAPAMAEVMAEARRRSKPPD